MSALEAACQPETMWRKARHSQVRKVTLTSQYIANQIHQKNSRHQISRVLDQLGFGTEKKMGKNEIE